MNIKNSSIILLAAVLSLCLAAPPAWAGNVQRNRWEGVAIGIGAAVLGHALFNNHFNRRPEPEVVYRHPPHRRHKPYEGRKARGYWEIRKKWVPPTFERVWNPGHYNPRGHWIEGHWMEIEKEPGYWTEERVWISRYRGRNHD